jgi:hypothetical protein
VHDTERRDLAQPTQKRCCSLYSCEERGACSLDTCRFGHSLSIPHLSLGTTPHLITTTTMSDQSQTAANVPPAEPVLCKLGCGFFVSKSTRVFVKRSCSSFADDADEYPQPTATTTIPRAQAMEILLLSQCSIHLAHRIFKKATREIATGSMHSLKSR